jgi:hypothetical protein
VIPGGRTPEYLRLNPRLLEIVRHFAKEKTDPSRQSATPRKYSLLPEFCKESSAVVIPRLRRM